MVEDEAHPKRSSARTLLVYLVEILLIVASLYVFLEGWHRDIRFPLGFTNDSLVALMQSKSTIDNGWWWFNPFLGAPFGFDALAFPANSNVDQAIVWIVSRLIPDAMTAINVAWAAMVVLSGLSATWCLRMLGASTASAVVAGTLFALSPYALYRNVGHFWMVVYLVPFVSTAALLIASGRLFEREHGKALLGLILGCVLLGFNYVYYSFFGCFLLGVAAIGGYLTYRQPRVALAGGLLVATIAGCTLLNLAPSLYSWREHGTPVIIRQKVPAESEVYGLKIRQLVSPVFQHSFRPFRQWTEREAAAQFPLETENMVSRLGLVGTVGFLGLLGLLFVPGAADRLGSRSALIGASQLTLAAVLLGTVGGFGSLFSLLVSPQIRAYNRIAPFIAFFSLAAIALTIDALMKTRARRASAAAIVLAIGLVDQRMAAAGMNTEYPAITAEIPVLEQFVRQLESALPDQAMVLQLPFRTYLNDDGIARMRPYDHLKPYLVSNTIRWSYPALSNEQVAWQQTAAGLDSQQLHAHLAAEGFAAVVIDRYGYDDEGAAVTAAMSPESLADDIIAQTDRYVALDLRSLVGEHPPAPAPSVDRPVPSVCEGVVLAAIDGFGMVTAPAPGESLRVEGARESRVTGWAADQTAEQPAGGVDLLVDEQSFSTVYGLDRADVADYFKQPGYRSTGFTAVIPMTGFSQGEHQFALRMLSADGTCYYQSPPFPIVIE